MTMPAVSGMEITTEQTGLAPKQSMQATAAASLIGATIEWYDFILYGTAAALIFNEQFFPALDPIAGTLAALAAYAVGFGARPIGGLIFGHFGDRVGRKGMLVASMLMMGISTTTIGLLPTYQEIGIWAPILLVLLRLFQGVGLGGETGGAVLISVEHASAGRMNFFGGFPQMGVPAGTVLANMAFLLTSSMTSHEVFAAWAWRIPFLLSVILVAVGMIVRLRIAETPHFEAAKVKREIVAAPGLTALREYWPRITMTVLAIFASSSVAYVWSVFTLSYGSQALHLDRQSLLLGVTGGSLLWLISIPFWSSWADRNGRRGMFVGGTVALLCIAAAYFPLLNSKNAIAIVFAFVAMGLILPIAHSVQGSILADTFPAQVRYSGMGWALGIATVLGGMSPLIAASLFSVHGTSTLVSVYVTVTCIISVVNSFLLFRLTPSLNSGQYFSGKS